MADLVITPGNVAPVSNVVYKGNNPIAGVALVAGQMCYVDGSGFAQLTQATTTPEQAAEALIAMCNAAAGQPILLAQAGRIKVAAAGLIAGTVYYLSNTAGSLNDVSPTTGNYVTVFAYAVDTQILQISTIIMGLAKG